MVEKRVGKFTDINSTYPSVIHVGKNIVHEKPHLVPKEMELQRKIGVTLVSVSEKGSSDTVYFETDSLLSATRILNTYKPKRGYKLAKSTFEEVGVLV